MSECLTAEGACASCRNAVAPPRFDRQKRLLPDAPYKGSGPGWCNKYASAFQPLAEPDITRPINTCWEKP